MIAPRRLGASIAAVAAALLGGALAAPEPASSIPLLPPTAALSAAPNPVLVGETVAFDASGSTGDGFSTVDLYEWDLDGNGSFETNTGSSPSAARAYANPGEVTVALRVTDSDGDQDQDSLALKVNAPPTASFIFEPSNPAVGEPVTFSSTASDPEGPLGTQGWDLDGDGQFDDGQGATIQHTFTRPGTVEVGLAVVDGDGAVDTVTRSVEVGASTFELMSPFPIVRLQGEILASGKTVIKRLAVKAPAGALVSARCRGTGCPFDWRHREASDQRVRFRNFRKPLKPGTRLATYVREPNKVGKFTSFRMRRGKAPKRKDRCLAGSDQQPIECPQ